MGTTLLREAPNSAERARLFGRYRTTLAAAGLPFTEIGGVGAAREAVATAAVRAAITHVAAEGMLGCK